MLNQPLYSHSYARTGSATAREHAWMMLALSSSKLALPEPAAPPLALMSPACDMDGLD